MEQAYELKDKLTNFYNSDYNHAWHENDFYADYSFCDYENFDCCDDFYHAPERCKQVQ